MSAPTIITIRPGVAFAPPAAASFRRLERALGRQVDVNSTYRDWDLQLRMYNDWRAYVDGTGPRPAHSRAIHPKYSKHCQGLALDSDDWRTPGFIPLAEEHGWIRTAASDPTERHHFEYQWWRDQHRNDPAPAGHTIPTTQEDEEDDMASLKGATYVRAADKANVCILFNEASGFYFEHTGVGGKYNNPIAENWGTGTWPPITESHATVIKRALDAVRRTTVAGSLSVDLDEQ